MLVAYLDAVGIRTALVLPQRTNSVIQITEASTRFVAWKLFAGGLRFDMSVYQAFFSTCILNWNCLKQRRHCRVQSGEAIC